MDQAILAALMDKYLKGETTVSEEAALEAWYREQIGGEIVWDAADEHEKTLLRNEMFHIIQAGKNKQAGEAPHVFMKTRKSRNWLRIAAAVTVFAALTFAVYLMQHVSPGDHIAKNMTNRDSIVPGSNGAILTLANGKKIVLDSATVGNTLTTQGSTALQKAGDSLLVYQSGNSSDSATASISYNILETPKGRQFSVVLPDGSRVWLNAASSLKYPTAFTGKSRTVALSGEAYFEVVHNDRQPFKVIAGNQTIEDVGTVFNVNSYAEEQFATTLVNGAVKVNGQLLKPGQQSNGSQIKTVDVDHFIAWKNGDFDFEGDHIQTIMHQLARWYDIDVSYQGQIPKNKVFYASISRQRNIGDVLHLLEQTQGIHFKIEDRRVIVIR